MKVMIEVSDFNHTVSFLFYSGPSELRPGDVLHVAKPVELEFETKDEFTDVKPTLRVCGGREFLQSLRDALDDLGIPSNRHAKVEGLLEAQKEHLSDMRKLVFKAAND